MHELGLVLESVAISCSLYTSPLILLLFKHSFSIGWTKSRSLPQAWINSVFAHHNVTLSSAVTHSSFQLTFLEYGTLGARNRRGKQAVCHCLSPAMELLLVLPALSSVGRKKWLFCMGWPVVQLIEELRNAVSSGWPQSL